MRLLVGTVSLVLLAGCATTFRPWNLSEIHEGMDRSEVVQVLGEPDFTEMADGEEQLHYLYQEDYNPSANATPFYAQDSNMAFRDLEKRTAFKEYEYVVVLVDGKVVRYSEL